MLSELWSYGFRLLDRHTELPAQDTWLVDVTTHERLDVVLESGLPKQTHSDYHVYLVEDQGRTDDDLGIGVEEIVICRSEDLADVDVHACGQVDVECECTI